ncbi:Mrp/NBP35 family ATP-binding protein [Maritimibacter sp. DP1N21-5]|uniref:Mrp/NBP35 family ATP-binding protein n=1 Tax=Maritimibacter sp. DP1N21-5 TaxID=2836867 RepID=UPI001C47473E|nr:Mrp/NBP35 family ATP-binding protein [Maritimibacter sp. DP1N21-5]MBV7409344.1 Mrp/NBP35 family ATP-binding protein [Maritimibacter sp. DP1N21-5]
MAITRDQIHSSLSSVALPDGGDLVSRDMVRALTVEGGTVSFVIEAPSPDAAGKMEPLRRAAEDAVRSLPGVDKVTVILTAHGPSAKKPAGDAPNLRVGGHPKPQAGPMAIPGVARVIAVASGKGGVGKSTVSSNLAVALAAAGRRVGLLDADILGPSQALMMGITEKPTSSDGKNLDPVSGHGVKVMSVGMIVDPDQAVVWRGPMLMGTLQQFAFQVNWGDLDVLIVDLPPGTGDVQLTLAQKVEMTGALVVSTPQDVALLDAHKAIDMFGKVNVPILGLIENMSSYICPQCGHEAHLFGHGGVAEEARRVGAPLLAQLPLSLDVRLAGDAGVPVALTEGAVGEAYRALATDLVARGIA